MKETQKAPAMDSFIRTLMGKDRAVVIRNGLCMTCDSTGNMLEWKWRDELSKKEYAISGMCQSCQDDFFGISEDDA